MKIMNEFLEAMNISTCECVVGDNFKTFHPCIVCGERIETSICDPHIVICEKCKQAILYMREQLEDIKWN